MPTSTGGAKTTELVIPALRGKLNGCAIRVPTPAGSLTDFTVVTSKPTTKEAVNAAFEKAANGPLRNILKYETRPLVLKDFVGDPHSCIFDAALTQVIGGNMVKVFGWYDNEWGYSCRLVELAEYIGKQL